MVAATHRKLYLGPRLRGLRRELGLNQTRMAEELGVSASYLNHLERNQRPLTTQMLLRLAETYDLDIRGFVAGASEAAAGGLAEVFADPVVRDLGVPRQEMLEVAENYPGVAEAIARLYRALVDHRHEPDRLVGAGAGGLSSPLNWLRDLLDARRNHFAEIDAAAEALSAQLGEGPEALREGLVRRLQDAHKIAVRIEPRPVMPDLLRHYSYHRRRLSLSEALPPSGRLFGCAYQLAVEALGEVIAETVARAAPPDDEALGLARTALTNYAAAALVMPYGRFHAAATAERYDLDLICARFGVSYEQAAHRLTTLGRPGARGVPFFMTRLDVAGNVSKRFAGEALPLARYGGGGCPRWRVHRAARAVGETVFDLVETPDAVRYFTFARALRRPGAAEPHVIVLGCEAAHLGRIAYADAFAAAAPNPIGPACQLCERLDCRERALPPLSRALDLHAFQRTAAPYPFRVG